MAAVIRSARIDPERMVISIRARPAAIGESRVDPNVDADRAFARPAADPAMPPTIPAAWMSTPSALNEIAPEFDRDLVERNFRAALEAERHDVLERAHAEGYERGREEAGAAREEHIAALAAVLRSAHEAVATEIAGSEDIVVEIAFEAVCKILGEAVATRGGVVAIVREVLRTVRERERLLVRVAPADLTILEENRAQLAPGDDGATLDLVADERVGLGGCLVETTGGTLDGRLETQMQRLIETLTSARRMQGMQGEAPA